jgi:hypothetical protein
VLAGTVPASLVSSVLRVLVAAVAVLAALLMLSSAVPGELADHAAAGALVLDNGANAPADNPEDADTLPARGRRPDLARRCGESAAAAEAPAADEAGASAPGEGSRGTPGTSQPGSDIVASLRQDRHLSQPLTHSIIVPSADISRAIIRRLAGRCEVDKVQPPLRGHQALPSLQTLR